MTDYPVAPYALPSVESRFDTTAIDAISESTRNGTSVLGIGGEESITGCAPWEPVSAPPDKPVQYYLAMYEREVIAGAYPPRASFSVVQEMVNNDEPQYMQEAVIAKMGRDRVIRMALGLNQAWI